MKPIFVFGSNLAGIHGAGSALHAYKHLGAEWGVGVGPTGKCYAIPTKDERLKTLPLFEVARRVTAFICYAAQYPKLSFEVVKIGCGLAGFTEKQIAPLFAAAPSNVVLPSGWRA